MSKPHLFQTAGHPVRTATEAGVKPRASSPRGPLTTLALGLLLWATAVQAQNAQPSRQEVPPPPPLGANASSADLEPAITIRKEGDREIEEYRVRGRLFAMRVKVKGAPAYWLVDNDGSGRMVPGQGIGPSISVPMWVLREF